MPAPTTLSLTGARMPAGFGPQFARPCPGGGFRSDHGAEIGVHMLPAGWQAAGAAPVLFCRRPSTASHTAWPRHPALCRCRRGARAAGATRGPREGDIQAHRRVWSPSPFAACRRHAAAPPHGCRERLPVCRVSTPPHRPATLEAGTVRHYRTWAAQLQARYQVFNPDAARPAKRVYVGNLPPQVTGACVSGGARAGAVQQRGRGGARGLLPPRLACSATRHHAGALPPADAPPAAALQRLSCGIQ